MKDKYIFKSERLGFRKWKKEDLTEFHELNSDLNVMEFFPKPLTKNETSKFIERLQKHHEKHGYTYFAVETLKTEEFIGFIGLAYQDYKSDFTPATDIGWRLKKSAWGKGYATEGAKKCIDYGFNTLNLDTIISVYAEKNEKSKNVMEKIGMKYIGEFNHPELKEYPEYEKCICFKINKTPLN